MYAARNNFKKVRSATLGWVIPDRVRNCVIMPENWVKNNRCADNMWQRWLRKRRESVCLGKPEATSLTQCTSFNDENAKGFFLFEEIYVKKISLLLKSVWIGWDSWSVLFMYLKIICAAQMNGCCHFRGERGRLSFDSSLDCPLYMPYSLWPSCLTPNSMFKSVICHTSGGTTG